MDKVLVLKATENGTVGVEMKQDWTSTIRIWTATRLILSKHTVW